MNYAHRWHCGYYIYTKERQMKTNLREQIEKILEDNYDDKEAIVFKLLELFEEQRKKKEFLGSQIDELANYILDKYPTEITDGGAVEVAIKILKKHENESNVLSASTNGETDAGQAEEKMQENELSRMAKWQNEQEEKGQDGKK